MKYEVALKDLRHAGACYSGYNKLVRALQCAPFTEEDEKRESYVPYAHDKPIQISSILESNGLDDAIWALRCVKNADRDIRLFGVWCARQVQHLIEDQRAMKALDVAERFANGNASAEALDAAWAAAGDAARAAALDAQAEMLKRMCQGEAEWQTVKALVTH